MLTFAACVVVGTILTQPVATPSPAAPGGSPAAEQLDWRSTEPPYLTRHVQLTRPEDFSRAGEAYFDHQKPARWVVFQAIPRPAAGQAPDANYGMYIAKLVRDAAGGVTGIETPTLISAPGSYNTCGWFHPSEPGVITWGSTVVAPTMTDAPGYSKDRRRYSWQFPPETEVVAFGVMDVWMDFQGQQVSASMQRWRRQNPGSELALIQPPPPPDYVRRSDPAPLFSRPGYDAEGSYSPDGRFYLYTHVDPANNDPNLWIFDTKTKAHTPIVTARGYDGGPFFHPDFPRTPWICYRSDRRGDNNLQLFIGEIALGNDADPSVPIGLAREIQVTDDADIVNWCPYWHPTGGYLVFASSAVSHANYEVFAIKVDQALFPTRTPAAAGEGKDATPAAKPEDGATPPALATPAKDWPRVRVTSATGFDGLPAFSADGTLMMWTSQRGPKLEGEQRPSSQLWIAEVVGEPAWNATPRTPAPRTTTPPAPSP